MDARVVTEVPGEPEPVPMRGLTRSVGTQRAGSEPACLPRALVLLGIGNAAGVIGLAFHNIGVLGKLYSEAIEGIDPGPLEAITATGANRVQVIWTAVIPQIVNPYISFTIYRLDANVRLAPILGLVGGGGIGILLFQSINLLQYGAAGLIIFMIVITVASMDFASAQIRRRLL